MSTKSQENSEFVTASDASISDTSADNGSSSSSDIIGAVPFSGPFDFFRELLKCINCKRTCLLFTIYQCKKGHILCSKCYGGVLPFCEGCRGFLAIPKNFIRNRVAEEIALQSRVYCPYKKNGCGQGFKLKMMGAHLLECQFSVNRFCRKIFNYTRKSDVDACFFYFDGHKNAQFLQHLRERHGLGGSTTGRLSISMDVATKKEMFWRAFDYQQSIHYLQFDERMFILKTKYSVLKKEIFWTVLFLGPSSAAKNYRAHLHLVFGSEESDQAHGFKIEWEGNVVGFEGLGHKDDRNEKLILPWSTYKSQKKRFAAENVNLAVHAKIMCAASEHEADARASARTSS